MGEGAEEVGEVIDTPERSKNSQIAASINKFEESPVFNFLNSLSPIKPVKSTHITQTINPLSFASLPSVFASPHVSSLREPRFLRRHQLSDPSKPEFSSDDGSKTNTNKSITDGTKKSDEQNDEVAAESCYDCSKFVVDFPEGYDCASPKGKHRADYASSSSALISIQEVPQNGSYGADEIGQNKQPAPSDWENLISDASELLIFESPDCADPCKRNIDAGMDFCTSIENGVQNMQVLEGNEPETLSTQPGEGNAVENADTCDVNADEKADCEMGGARRRHLNESSGPDSSALQQSDGNTSSNDQSLVPINPVNESSRRLLPGIGLHLNALATTPKGYKIVSHDSSMPGRLLIGPSLAVNVRPLTTSQELLNDNLSVGSLDREIDNAENVLLPVEDARQQSGYGVNEEINQNSPKKKRRKAEQAGDGEACKRCNCKRSKCLKLYCECFAAGVYCVEPCACIDCFNKPIHEDTVLATRKQIESRNPLAFAPKVIRGSDSPLEAGDDSSKTPASARHKRGCNCKKSGCLKKYCECYQGGVGCSVNCRCEGCKNAFGRKDGMEAEAEEEETDATEKSKPERGLLKNTVESDLEQTTDSVPPATPLRAGRQSAQPQFSSKKKPPRSSFPSIASISGFHARQTFGKPSFLPPQPPPLPPKLDNQSEAIGEEEMPDFLQGGSRAGGINSSSPNRKRVSPPHGEEMPPPGLRSSRKLILQSIPAFPSLTPNQ